MKSPVDLTHANDRTADRRLLILSVLILSVLIIGGLFGFGSTAQSMMVLGAPPMLVGDTPLHPALEATLRISLNVLTAMVLAVLAVLFGVHYRRPAIAYPLALLIAMVSSAARVVTQMAIGIFPWGDPQAINGGVIVVPIALVVIIIGMAIVDLNRRARAADRARLTATVRAALALEELQKEELRVRREVADTLHGTLQHRFVLLETQIRDIAEHLEQGPDSRELPELGARLLGLSRELDLLRERELRELSAALYPESLDRGLVPATRALVARIPRTIPVEFSAKGVPTPDPLDHTPRLLLVRVVEEGISNALRHGRANAIQLKLAVADDEYVVEVRHQGIVPPEDRTFSGLARLRARLAAYGGELELHPEPHGAVLRARFPVSQDPRI